MINKTPLFSILMAQYNNGKYLQEAIDSVKSQTYLNWEIILVDDASTDNSYDLYKLYENDNRIKIFYNDENKGCGYTKHRCVELANGEICGFLDPDDVLLPEALHLMQKKHSESENISLVHSNYIECDKYLNQIRVNPQACEIPIGTDYLHFRRYAVCHFVSFKKRLYNKTIGINLEYKRAIDQDLYFKMEEVGTLAFIKKPLYLYRIHDNGISLGTNEFKAFFWYIKAIDDACDRRGISEEAEIIVSKLMNSLVQPYENIIDVLNKKFKYPTLRIIVGMIYKFVFKKIIKVE